MRTVLEQSLHWPMPIERNGRLVRLERDCPGCAYYELDDLLCVGATDNILLSSTIGRNKQRIPGEVLGAIINGTEELINDLAQHGISIKSTGGETADVGDLVQTIIVDSTVVARMRRDQVIDNANIQPGDVIVGLASFGQAHYETTYNGGMGSNGLTSARHDVFNASLKEKYPRHSMPLSPKSSRTQGQKTSLLQLKELPRCREISVVANTDLCPHHQKNIRST